MLPHTLMPAAGFYLRSITNKLDFRVIFYLHTSAVTTYITTRGDRLDAYSHLLTEWKDESKRVFKIYQHLPQKQTRKTNDKKKRNSRK